MSDPTRLAVLYVDDDKDIRHIVSLALSLDPEIELRVATSGVEALALLNSDPWRPELVLLDVMMPGIDGPTLMARIRDEHGLQDVPFIFITAKAREADVLSYMNLGAAGFILKPFDPITLGARIKSISRER